MKIHFTNPCALAAALVLTTLSTGALAASGANHPAAQHQASSCAALASVPALVDAAAGSPIAYLVRSIIEPHGWRLVTNAPDHWQGPGVSANIHGLSAADALRALSDAASAAGWQVRTSAHRNECVVRMSFNGSQIPHAAAPAVAPNQIVSAPVAAAAVVPEQAPAPAPAPAPVDTSLRVQAGDLLGERLSAWAKLHGYTLTWQAGALRAGADLHLPGQVEPVLESLAQAMRFNDVHLEIEIFANRAVRIQEVR